MKIYGIKSCGSVKKAFKFFDDHNIEYEFIDLKKTSISSEKIDKWLTHVEMKKLFNSCSSTYRNLNLKDKNLDDDEKKEYLISENMLIKRPVIEYEDRVIVGFDEKIYKEEFLS